MVWQRAASTRVSYRPDIDGLRAVAVLLVLFNHLGIRRFSGGFVGVDVFFVISGYLISALILKEIAAGQFSIGRFYQRRIRRIMPALLVMLLVTSAVSYHYFYPVENKAFAETELGALFSVSNVVLLHGGGYFDPAVRFEPLLHTWSLGVEEQFYVVFPLLLLGIMRWFPRALKYVLWTLAVGGFALACAWLPKHSSETFYLAPFRAWEFVAGTLLASRALPALKTPWMRDVASATGLALILWSSTRFTDTTPFPGMNALLPCLGALLVIAAGESGTSLVSKALAWNPIRWIGVISYSLYLWHWPIQLFQATENILVPDRYSYQIARLAVVAASFAMAALSWRFVEQPFRAGSFRKSRAALYVPGGLVFASLIWFSATVIHAEGWPVRSLPTSVAAMDYGKGTPTVEQVRWRNCFLTPSDFPGHFDPSTCLAPDPSRRHFLVLGDSHAAHTYYGMKTIFPEINFSLFSIATCQPAIEEPAWKSANCDGSMHSIFEEYLRHHPVETVVLVAKWGVWDTWHLEETIDWIKDHGMQVIVVGPSIEFDAPLPRLIRISQREHDPLLLSRHRSVEQEVLDRKMKELARDKWDVHYISMYDDLCKPQWIIGGVGASGCPVYGAPNIGLVFDADHLSPSGSLMFARAIREDHQLD